MQAPIPQFWPGSGHVSLSLTELKHSLGLLQIQLTKRPTLYNCLCFASLCHLPAALSWDSLGWVALFLILKVLDTAWLCKLILSRHIFEVCQPSVTGHSMVALKLASSNSH